MKTQTLIIFMHGIGDNVMFTGVLHEYKKKYPNEAITLAVLNKACHEIWTGNDDVDFIVPYPHPQPRYWNPVMFQFDRLQVNAWQAGQYSRYDKILFPVVQGVPEILYHLLGNYGESKVHRMADEVGVVARLYPYRLFTTDEDRIRAEKFSMGHKKIAVFHPFSGDSARNYMAITETISNLRHDGYFVIAVGSSEDSKKFYSIPETWKVCGMFGSSFGVLIELLKLSKLFVGCDSLVAHLSAFANVPEIRVSCRRVVGWRYKLPTSGNVTVLPL